MTILTQSRLKELLTYEPETGFFTRLTSPCHKVKAGEVAGSINKRGYVEIKVDYKKYLGHRLASLYMRGHFPINIFDHIDCNKSNNSWINLRDATNAQNSQNIKKAKVNNNLLLGVTKNKNCSTFKALIGLNNKIIHIGSFKTAELAHQAYLDAKRKLHEFSTI